jgi:hypothetical protein
MYTDYIVVDIRFSYVNVDEIQGYYKLYGQYEVNFKTVKHMELGHNKTRKFSLATWTVIHGCKFYCDHYKNKVNMACVGRMGQFIRL